MSIRLVLVDDHELVRQGLRALFDREPGFEVVAEGANGREAVALADECAPDLVVTDVAMPELNGIDATRQIRARHPDIRIVAVSQYSERNVVARMLSAGASGYVLKSDGWDELAKAINKVMAGQRYVSKKLLMEGDEVVSTPDTARGLPVLTPRQLEVLQLLVEGRSTAEIAATLYVSPNTVGTHRHHIMKKLGTRTLADLTRYALRQGMIYADPPPVA